MRVISDCWTCPTSHLRPFPVVARLLFHFLSGQSTDTEVNFLTALFSQQTS